VYERNEPNRASDGAVAPVRSGPSPLLIGFVIVVALALVFVLQNGETADIHVLFFEFTASVWVAIAIAIGIGILLDRILLAWWRRRRRDDR
jgi:uncharacterized integral membrane protein